MTTHTTQYGAFEIAAGGFDGVWRSDLYTPKSGSTSIGTPSIMERRMCAGSNDLSPPRVTYPTGYDSKCSCCYLNISHTEDLHQQKCSQ